MSAHETLGAGRGTFFDKRADGTFGPVEDIKIDVLVTPEQWDALGRIGAPGSLASGAQKDLPDEVREDATRLLEIVNDPESSPDEVAEVYESIQKLTERLSKPTPTSSSASNAPSSQKRSPQLPRTSRPSIPTD
ncbi:hypothetical protein ACWCQ0_33605 [Streptomyces massasporeus]|uniref:hypothetical protein n=1 Tax=Streptomyces massasporeus TaxID=67324 RepID=UPI0033C0C000